MLEDFEKVVKRCSSLPAAAGRIWADWQIANPDWSPDTLGAHLELLRMVPGMASAVDRAIARQRANKPKAAAQGSQEPSGPQAFKTIPGWLMDAGCPDEWLTTDDHPVPNGWACAVGRLYKVGPTGTSTLIAAAPVAIVGRSVDADTETVCVDVVWRYAGRWTRSTVRRRDALTRDGLLGPLLSQGLPVDQSTATDLTKWLAACDAALSAEPGQSLSRLGWLPDGTGFAPLTVRAIPPGDGERDVIRGYTAGGTWDAWHEEVWLRVTGQRAEIAILASLAAPLLHVVQQPGWTLDLGFRRGSGKTTAQQAAVSVWGSRRTLTPWPRTWAGMRSVAEFRSDVPAILDDTKNVGANWHLVKDFLYQVSSEESQVLGSAGGGTRSSRLLRTIVISSGESPIADHLQGADGASFRILTLGERPFPSGFGQTVKAIERATREHYGHAGPRLVHWLIRKRETWPALARRFRDHSTRIGSGADDTGRLGDRLALLYLAADLAEEALGLRPSPAVLEAFTRHALGGQADRDMAAESLRHVVSYLNARPAQVMGWNVVPMRQPYLAAQGTPMDPRGSELLLVASELGPILESGGYDPREIRRAWLDRGWLGRTEIGKDGRPRTDVVARVDGRPTRVVPVLKSAWEEE
jgi:hypothetical protein